MAIGLLGRKVGMTQVFDEAGAVIPVTVIQAGPCHVLQVRTAQRDGYDGVQLGFLDKPRRLASRSQRGQSSARNRPRHRAFSLNLKRALVTQGSEMLVTSQSKYIVLDSRNG